MNKERPRPPAGGVSCNWKFDENQESHGFSENKERARLPAGGVNCNWKLDENHVLGMSYFDLICRFGVKFMDFQ